MNSSNSILITILASLLLITNASAGSYAGGSSTASGENFENAILIEDVPDLIKLSLDSLNWDKYYKQTADIIFADSTDQDWGWGYSDEYWTHGFSPIGTESKPFKGSYDGGGYKIDKLFINRKASSSYGDSLVALFGMVDSENEIDSVIIKNLEIGENSIIRAQSAYFSESPSIYISSLVAYSKNNLRIENSCNKAVISVDFNYSSAYAGGLVGFADTLTITNSFNTGAVGGESSDITYAGGLVSKSNVSKIINSYNTGQIYITDNNYLGGGLIGYTNFSFEIINSYNTGKISGSKYSGGLVGIIGINGTVSKIINSYNTGTVFSGFYAGGLVGYSMASLFTITKSYNTGRVSSYLNKYNSDNSDPYRGYSGGFVGYSSSVEISNSYNKGRVKAVATVCYSGGFVGGANRDAEDMSSIVIKNSYNNASVTTDAPSAGASGSQSTSYYLYSGGFIGGTYNSIPEITNSYNSGNISSTTKEDTNYKSYHPYVNGFGVFLTDENIINSFVDYQLGGFDEFKHNYSYRFEAFKYAELYAGKGWFSEITDDENPWVYNENGRPYLYWEDVAVSNSIVESDTLEVSVINQTFIQEIGLKYCDTFYENCAYDKAVDDKVVFESLDVNKIYYLRPYVLSTSGYYHYGDEFIFTPSEDTKEIIIKLNQVNINIPQTITFAAIDNQLDSVKNIALVASASSGEPVSFISNTKDVCTITGTTLNLVGLGECSVTATQDGTDEYASASPITRSFSIIENGTTNVFTKINLNFSPRNVEIYTLKGEFVRSKYCSTLNDYRELVSNLGKNNRFLIK